MGPPQGSTSDGVAEGHRHLTVQRLWQVAMAFREVRAFEIREVLRLWLRGEGFRSIERLGPVDRKTVRHYVEAAGECSLVRDGPPCAFMV